MKPLAGTIKRLTIKANKTTKIKTGLYEVEREQIY